MSTPARGRFFLEKLSRCLLGCVALAFLISSEACSHFQNGGGGGQNAVSPAVLKIGGEYVGRDSFDSYVRQSLGQERERAGSTALTTILNQFAERRLLAMSGSQEGIQPQDSDRVRLARALGLSSGQEQGISGDELLAQAYLARKLAGRLLITETELRQRYEKSQKHDPIPERYHVREILVKTPELGNRIRHELDVAGLTRFPSFARQFSVAPTAASGGDMGCFESGELPQEFEKAITSLRPGQISPLVRTPYGYHIFYLEEKIQAHPKKFFEVQDELRDELRQEKERLVHRETVDEAAKRLPVTVFRSSLGFALDRNVLAPYIKLEDRP